MADDKTAIVNMAFASIGEENVSSIDENTPLAIKAKSFFESMVLFLLSDDWFFARDREKLTASPANNPTFGRYEKAFVLPSDYLFTERGLCDQFDDKTRYEYEIEGEFLLTNQIDAYFLYNKKIIDVSGVSDVSKMRIWFHRLISARLAFILSPNITENQRLRAKVELEWKEAYLDAKEKNGAEAFYREQAGNNDWRDGARNLLYIERTY